jgi:hypothetical protein
VSPHVRNRSEAAIQSGSARNLGSDHLEVASRGDCPSLRATFFRALRFARGAPELVPPCTQHLRFPLTAGDWHPPPPSFIGYIAREFWERPPLFPDADCLSLALDICPLATHSGHSGLTSEFDPSRNTARAGLLGVRPSCTTDPSANYMQM